MQDNIVKVVLKIIENSEEPLETKEIQEKIKISIKGVTRTKLFYRLNILRGDGVIKGKFVGPGKGVWIWWRLKLFSKAKEAKK